MLNSYVWDLYLKSGGDKAVAFFKDNLSPSLPLRDFQLLILDCLCLIISSQPTMC